MAGIHCFEELRPALEYRQSPQHYRSQGIASPLSHCYHAFPESPDRYAVKRNTVIVIIALTLISLMILGDKILAKVLDNRLPALLTEQLGLPVRLAPIDADILTLMMHTVAKVLQPSILCLLAWFVNNPTSC